MRRGQNSGRSFFDHHDKLRFAFETDIRVHVFVERELVMSKYLSELRERKGLELSAPALAMDDDAVFHRRSMVHGVTSDRFGCTSGAEGYC
jgi:hypothetical protein